MSGLPDLASESPLWLALVTVGANALVGALQGLDGARHWDFVGVSVFALLMGLGGGFIRDALIGNLPAESLRSPWYLVSVLVAVVVALLAGEWLRHVRLLVIFLDTLGMGLFAVTGAAHTIHAGLPATSAVLVGTASAVGGGMLVSVLRDEVPRVLLASTPNALLAIAACLVYVPVARWNPSDASLIAIGAVILIRYLTVRFGVRTRPTPALVERARV